MLIGLSILNHPALGCFFSSHMEPPQMEMFSRTLGSPLTERRAEVWDTGFTLLHIDSEKLTGWKQGNPYWGNDKRRVKSYLKGENVTLTEWLGVWGTKTDVHVYTYIYIHTRNYVITYHILTYCTQIYIYIHILYAYCIHTVHTHNQSLMKKLVKWRAPQCWSRIFFHSFIVATLKAGNRLPNSSALIRAIHRIHSHPSLGLRILTVLHFEALKSDCPLVINHCNGESTI